MNRTFLWAALLALGTAGAGAETSPQKVERLQHGIDGASELGNFTRVQQLRLELADEWARQGQYAYAARQYELVLASRPRKSERVRLFVQLGRMRSAAQDYGGAIGAFQDALHDDPDDWDANLELARSYSKVEMNTNAIQTFQRCVKLRPKDPQAYHELGDVYQRLGYLTRAIASYNKALELKPEADTYMSLADCYVRLGQMDQATQVLQKAKTSLPRAEYDVRLGDIFRKRGDFAPAAAAWEEALKADPKRDDVRLKLMIIYGQLRRTEEADRLGKQLAAAYPGSPLVHFLKAWVLLDRGDREGARREALIVRGLAPTELVQHYNERLINLLGK